MPKPNRGDTTKLSIRLSREARHVDAENNVTGLIEQAAKNLGISAAGVILFELTRILESPPTLSEIETWKDEITLERKHFALTVNKEVAEQVNKLAEQYGMKKNILVGLIISKRFSENPPENWKNTEPKKLMLQVNHELKKKMMDWCEQNYIPLNAVVSYSVLQGLPDVLPQYEAEEHETIFTNVPEYIGEIIKEKSSKYSIREHFYTSSCIYKQFMLPGGRFYKTSKDTRIEQKKGTNDGPSQ